MVEGRWFKVNFICRRTGWWRGFVLEVVVVVVGSFIRVVRLVRGYKVLWGDSRYCC